MPRIFLSKLLPPDVSQALQRPRLLGSNGERVLVAQAPCGSGKSVFLAQWLSAGERSYLYYQMDEQDADGAVFRAHLLAGLKRKWPEWVPPPETAHDPGALAAELVNEAVMRPPFTLVLDGLEAAFGAPYLTDFLSIMLKYAPPTLTLCLGTRAPLPLDVAAVGQRRVRLVTAGELAMTQDEVDAWLGTGDWGGCFEVTGGHPYALLCWKQAGPGWRAALAGRMLTNLPSHLSSDPAVALVEQWVAGHLPLDSFAFQLSQGAPGVEQLWDELHKVRGGLLMGQLKSLTQLTPLWEKARTQGDAQLLGGVSLLIGEAYYGLGEYGQAMEWYHRAFEADPLLETTGTHSLVSILRDMGNLTEAEALGRRCVEARRSRSDLQAMTYAYCQYASVLAELGRFDEAEEHYQAAERYGLTLSGEPFYGILAKAQRAVLQVLAGRPAAYRAMAEEAHALAKRRSPWLEAICAYILAPGLLAWGEKEAAGRLLKHSLARLHDLGCKWQLHMVHTILARVAWADGRLDEARSQFDQALEYASREGYVQYLQGERSGALELVLDAMVRGAHVRYCQYLLIRMGPRALPRLLELGRHESPVARRAALYPLVSIGGEEAAAAIRRLLYDQDEQVRDGALLAMQGLSGAGASLVAAPPVGAPGAGPSLATAPPVGAPGAGPGLTAAPPAGAPALRVNLLGPLEVLLDGKRLEGWRTAKVRDLLAYLALFAGRPVTKGQLLDALWPEADAESGQALLHTTLYQLRRILKPAGDVITYAGGAYRLEPDLVQLDLNLFTSAFAAATEEGWRAAADLYRSELLEGVDYPWAEGPRTRTRSAYLEALRSLAAYYRTQGRPTAAVPWLQLLIQVEPLAEEGHVALMECYADSGNRHAALQQYRTLAHLLDEEMGLEPGAGAQALYRKLLD